MSSKVYEEIPITTLASGYRLALPVHRVTGAQPGPTLGLTAMIHGDEPLPIVIIQRLLKELDPDQLKGTVLMMPAARFCDFLADHPAVQRDLLVRVIADLRKQSHRTFEFGVGDALGRVCRCIADMADRYGTARDDHVELESPLSQHDMAAWIGLSREAVVKALRTLRSLGLIENHGRSFVINDLDAVRARADM